ncbi:sirohydrochlorin chelatase [Priestia taiwanensis]|uniref:Cobalamin biosynthesis protein CbiX n=1 Tax=Priestia taiwanensis TaxID=1347902 RepID=A0A917EQD5_9BACI|nr:sirohydrochlorin chelatase [Priestia taiwanensis]MBM7364040.1 sirohydrochlorin ferrochelatase [Priestia taiwanensis]GGE71157.1 cobalamin biosynthesis protein CbiX [Priestia taiwanensis]
MEAVLFVCHGSRVKKACEQAKSFVETSIASMGHVPIKEICFLELAEPSIEQGVAACVRQGATSIAVVPVLLLTAVHAKKDIPEELHHVWRKYQQITMTYGRPFGVHETIIPILEERIHAETVPPEGATVLLVGRGSSDADVKHDLEEIAWMLEKYGMYTRVDTCYLAAATPRFEEKLAELVSTEKHVIVVPYLLFTGLLMNGMEREVRQYENVTLCQYLGYHPALQQILIDRAEEARNGLYRMEEEGLVKHS